ncbi:hypothetical protein BH23BAC4_BH23BAC4_07100 [soil metagenome]
MLVGLGLADLLMSVHRLLRARRIVRWDWLPLAAALLAALLILDLWWGFYGHLGMATVTFGAFLPAIVQLIFLFLLTAAVLPDRVPPEGLNLRAYYEGNRTYFWVLLAGYIVTILTYNASNYAFGGTAPLAVLRDFLPNLFLLSLCIGLAVSGRRAFHAIALLFLVAVSIAMWWGRQLGPM